MDIGIDSLTGRRKQKKKSGFITKIKIIIMNFRTT
ncbi:Arm DNA-binding domain-containing protein [Bacillus wiedmannii]